MKLNIDSFNSIFGEGKNGVRDRAYTQLVSGHYKYVRYIQIIN